MLEINRIHQGDCLILMKDIPDKSVNLILCDLPYGTSACSWDNVINLQEMWKEYKRIIADDGAIVLFSQQPFTSILISSNLEMYKYNWVWEKDNGTNFLNSHYQPLKITEDICVFGKASCSSTKTLHLKYNPQFEQGKAYTCISGKQKQDSAVVSGNVKDVDNHLTVSDGKRYPKNLIKFIRDKEKLHPTQKPVALCEYLVKTYSQENDIILDNTCGSGTIPLACKKNNRKFIGIELNPAFVELSNKRLGEIDVSLDMFKHKEVKVDGTTTDGIPSKTKVLGILPTIL